MPDEATRKRGRPRKYSEKLADDICVRLMLGESLRSICRDEKMPALRTVMYWLNGRGAPDEFVQHYARAREAQAELYADDIIEAADFDEGDDGGVYDRRARRMIEARKWYASKLVPKYADKLVHEGGETPIKTEDVSRDPEHLYELARRIAFILNGAAHEREKRHG